MVGARDGARPADEGGELRPGLCGGLEDEEVVEASLGVPGGGGGRWRVACEECAQLTPERESARHDSPI